MAKGFSTRTSFESARKTFASGDGPATARAEQQARKTGVLNPLVDPSGYGVIRRSLPRFEQRTDGLWEMAVGMPVPKEDRLDTTGSMGGNVDIAIGVLPDAYELCLSVLPGRDPQIATGIFGDVCDNFVLCRPQFEMDAAKITEQLTLMVPERNGGDSDEDPHYGLFGAAYLTATYIEQIGLKGYDFTVSDARARNRLDEKQIRRIFGQEAFEKAAENGYQINPNDLPNTKEVVQDLLHRAHAFFLQVGDDRNTTDFWVNIFGPERIVVLPETKLLPQVQAVIIGLTEGTLSLQDVLDFLRSNNVNNDVAKMIALSVAKIPIGAQASLPNFHKIPKKGDLFKEKTDLWPLSQEELESMNIEVGLDTAAGNDDEEPEWL